jgi:RNA polymerase sigma-70 factor (ECF subfamily)
MPRTSDFGLGLPPALVEEKELTLAFQRGEKDAYQAIHDRYSDRVHGVCRRMLGNRDDADEAAQETFLRTYQALGRFNGRYQMGAWITRIATNVSLDFLRTRARKTAGDRPFDDVEEIEPLSTMEEDDPAAVCVRNSESRHVRRMLASLPPTHRAAIVLRDFEGLSYEEIAVALKMTSPQVKALIHRARQSFKRSWLAARVSALVPGFLHRVRRIEDPARDHLVRSSSTGQLAEVAASSTPIITSCSAWLQSCGQLLTDKVVPYFVGAALTVGAVVTPGYTSERVAEEELKADVAVSADVVKGAVQHRDKEESPRGTGSGEGVSAEPVEEPVAEPTTAPTAPPAPEGEPPSEGEQPPAPLAPEPQGFTLNFGSDMATSSDPCTCMGPTAVHAQSHEFNGAHLSSFDQRLSGSASAAGTAVYGLELDHRIGGENHTTTFALKTSQGSYMYTAGGSLLESRKNEWGGMSSIYAGTYHLDSRPSSAEAVPQDGTYRVEIALSAANDRIVSVSFFLIEGSG